MRLLLFAIPLLLFATDPRKKAADYPAHAESDQVAVGAEYLVHSFSNGTVMLLAPDFLVVDTALYPKGPLTVHRDDFRLRVTMDKGEPLLLATQAPQFVGLTQQYSPMAGTNQQPRFPGDPGVGQQRTPIPRPARGQDDNVEPESPGQAAVRTALPEGEIHSAQGGFLFFPFSGKTKKIRSMDLLYKGPGGLITVKLF